MIKYLGSKRTLVPVLERVVASIDGAGTVLDLFAGTSRVGHALKRAGYAVTANDHNAYAHALAQCYVEADREVVERDASLLLREFSSLPGRPGYFTEVFCERSRYVHPRNGARIDSIREAIEAKGLAPELRAVVLVSLLEAADRVDSTCGVQMAYLKRWAARAHNDLELRLPDVLPRARSGPGRARCEDALALAQTISADVVYLDPPYNQHSYLGNYHVWESLVRWDKPEVFGVACKRVDCRERKSAFNSKVRARAALTELVDAIDAKVIVASFSNEGFLDREIMDEVLSRRGRVHVLAHDYKRYVGAQIGVFNPRGERVGEVSHLRNVEYVYVVETGRARVDLAWAQADAEIARVPGT